MSQIVPVLKDEQKERPVPTEWRGTFAEIVEGLKLCNFDLVRQVQGVRPISDDDAERFARNIKAYGAKLISLPEETWRTSVCQWMIGRWDVMVDLYTVEEGASDLVLHVHVYEEGSLYAFEIYSVHVP